MICRKGTYIRFKNLGKTFRVENGDIARIAKGGKGVWKIIILTGKLKDSAAEKKWHTPDEKHFDKMPRKKAEGLILLQTI
jgi:hypothetical protein